MCGDGVGMMGIVDDEGFPPKSLPADLGYLILVRFLLLYISRSMPGSPPSDIDTAKKKDD